MEMANESKEFDALGDETKQMTTEGTMAEKPKKGSRKTVVLVILFVLLALGGVGAYWTRDKSAEQDMKKAQATQVALQQKVTDLEKQLTMQKDKSKDTSDSAKPSDTPAPIVPSIALVDNIKAVFASGNSAALEGYMASTVNVIFAASEGLGNRTAAQATADITSFMTGATDPWNFSLPAATLINYRSGDYATYFPANAVVGKSNDMVISFSFNSDNKISGVFLTNVASVL